MAEDEPETTTEEEGTLGDQDAGPAEDDAPADDAPTDDEDAPNGAI